MGKQNGNTNQARQSVYNDLGLERNDVSYDQFSKMFDENEDFRNSVYNDLGFKDQGVNFDKFTTIMGKPTEVSAPGLAGTSGTSEEPTQSAQQQGGFPLQPNAGLSEQSLTGNEFVNRANALNQTLQQATGLEDPNNTFEIELQEGEEFLPNRLTDEGLPIIANRAEGTASNVLSPVDLQPTRAEAVAQNERIENQDKGIMSDLYGSLQQGLTDFNSNLAYIPEYMYRLGAIPQNLLADAIENNAGEGSAEWLRGRYENVENGVYNPLRILSDYAKSQSEQSEEYAQSVTQFDEDILGSITNGKFGDAGRQIVNSIVASAPAIVGMVATSGAGTAANLGNVGRTAINALPFSAGAYQDIEANEEMPENMKLIASGLKGLSEVVFEQEFGTLALIQSVARKTMGKEAVKDMAKGYMAKLLNSNGIPASIFKGSISEGSTTLAQNIVEKYSGENPDKDLWEGVADAMIVGGVMDAGISGLGSVASRINNPQIKEEVSEAEAQIAAMRQDLENLSAPQAQVLQRAIEAKAQEIDRAIGRDEAAAPALTESQRTQLDGIAKRAEEIQSVIDSEGSSEGTRAVLQQEIDALNQDRDLLIENAFAQGEVDQFVSDFQANNPNTTVDLFEDMPDQVVRTFNRVESGIPTDVVSINETSDWMYNKYRELSELKSSPDRIMTIPQIESIQEQLAQDIETLENYRYEQTGERSENTIESETEIDNVAGQEVTTQEGEQINENTEIPSEPIMEVADIPAETAVEQTEGVVDVTDMPIETIPQDETITETETVLPEAGQLDQNVVAETVEIDPTADQITTKVQTPVREEITPPEVVNEAETKTITDEAQTENTIEENEPAEVLPNTVQEGEDIDVASSATRDSKGKVKPLPVIAKSSTARKERISELKDRISKFRVSNNNQGISNNSKREAEHWRDVTDYAILSLIEGAVSTSQQLADTLGLPHTKRLIKAFSDAKKELFNNMEEYGNNGITAAKNSENARRRSEYGFDERITPVVVSHDSVEIEADKLIREGYDVNTLIDKALSGDPISSVETVILTKRLQVVEGSLVKANESIEANPNMNMTTMQNVVDRRNNAIDEMYRVIGALEMSGTVAARSLNIRRALLARDMSLGGMLSEMRTAVGNRELTQSEQKDIMDRYARVLDIKQKLEKRNADLERENIRLDAELELAREKYAAELEYRKSKNKIATKTEQIKDIQDRRAAAKASLSSALKDVFTPTSGFAVTSENEAKKMDSANKKIAKAMRDLVRTYIDEALVRAGQVNFDSIIDKIHTDVKESVPSVTREQVMNLIDSVNTDERPTKSDLQREVARFKAELKMVNEIAKLESGEKYVPKKKKEINDARLKYLRDRLKKIRKDNTAESVKVQDAVKSLNSRIKETQRKIADKEFSPERKQLVINDSEVKRLQKELNHEQFRFKVEARKAEYERRNILYKTSGFLREVVAVPRTLMATGDLSAPLRQTAFIFASRPLQIVPALGRMFQFYGSEKAYKDYFEDFKTTADFDLMVRAGVSLTDIAPNVGAAAREEQFMSAFVANAEKFVPGIGGGEVEVNGKKVKVPGLQLHSRAERGFTGFINKVRIDLFTHGAELLMRQGKFPDANISDYKKLATYVNAVSGRGPMPEQWSGVMADLSTVFFAPRLMTSRLWLIAGGPLWTGNSVTRQMYLRDLTSFIAFGSLAMATASLAGASVIGDDDDEILFGQGSGESWTNSDFGNIVVGDRRYDPWGGFGQYVRFFSRMAFGQKTSTTGRVTELNSDEWGSESYADLALRFGRSKLSPAASLLSSAMVGKNYMGEPFSLTQELKNMASPLVWQDTYEAWTDQNEGIKSMYTVFAPSFFGLGVQTWDMNSFLDKGADSKLGTMLAEKKVATMGADINRVKLYDPKDGVERQPTATEFKKYETVWSEYVKADLTDNYDKYRKMSADDFDRKFTAIKSAATVYAKKQLTGISNEDLIIESNNTTYKLTPDQVRKRVELNEQYVKQNKNDYKELEREYVLEGMNPDAAAIKAQKKMESDARRFSKAEILEASDSGTMKLQEK